MHYIESKIFNNMVILARYSLLIAVIQRATVLVGLSTVLFGKLKNCPNVLTGEISAKIGNGITTNWFMLDLHQHGIDKGYAKYAFISTSWQYSRYICNNLS